jgi:drug/metabolite transporter (DMT)-like permease
VSPVLMPRLLVVSTALLFSTGGAAIKATSLTAWQVASFRSGIAAVLLALCMPGWRRAWHPRTLAVGAAYAATMILFVVANKLTTAVNTIFLQYTAPLYLLVLGPWLLRERVRSADLLLIGALGAGMTLFFVGVEPPRETAPDPSRGNWLAALSGLSWALTILGLRWLGRDHDARGGDAAGAAVIAGNVLACLICLPLALPVAASRAADWITVSYLGLFQIGLAYLLLTRGVRRLPALETSLLLLCEPVLNGLWAWLLHGEAPGAWALAGCGLVLLATVAVATRDRA